MSSRNERRLAKKHRRFPPLDKVASVRVDPDNRQVIFTTNDMLVNQLYRDGPRIAKSFDRLARRHIEQCSALFATTNGLIIRHLPLVDNDGYKATASRLLASACNTYIASIEAARHGYPRQYGMLARTLIETLATVIVLTIRPTALDEFHAGSLDTAKCVGWAKPVMEPLGMYYGLLSRHFTHIGRNHAELALPRAYTKIDEPLAFVLNSLRANIWLIFVVTELVYHDEVEPNRYWFAQGGQAVAYDPSDGERGWMDEFLQVIEPED